MVAAAAIAIAGLGNGRWSVDQLLHRKARSGIAVALGAATFGVVSAAALLAASYRPDQEQSEPDGDSDKAETESQEA